MSGRKINFYLRSLRQAPEHHRLFSYADKLIAMQHVFMRIAPHPLARRCALGAFVGGELTICADNGAIAAKLRQTLPSLLLKFRSKGYEVTSIRIRVQANYHRMDADKLSNKGKRHIGLDGVGELITLANKLPQSPLKTAIEKLAKTHVENKEKN